MIAGRLRGHRIRAPRGRGVRPTSERVREALFARLGPLEGMRVLDLYSGSGALGIEALSRGAGSAVFVECSATALAVLRENLASLDLGGQARVVRGSAPVAVRRLGRTGERFDLVLLDPPYAGEEALRALAALVSARVLAPGARVVLESSRRAEPGPVEGLSVRSRHRYGDTLLTCLAPQGQGGEGPRCAADRAQ